MAKQMKGMKKMKVFNVLGAEIVVDDAQERYHELRVMADGFRNEFTKLMA